MSTLQEQAAEIGNNKTKLHKRLKDAASMLVDEVRPLFSGQPVNLEEKRMYSSCGRYYLQWENKGTSNRGSVSVKKNKQVQW